ncbi:hypothetical protein [Mycobacterium sp. 050134]|uniref:hypothetical protein n=1 Tax=Mycobacterium sp. 050134 TaxID=3096111 RepID=UPI002EDB0863
MADSHVAVIGSSPVSFHDSNGAQHVIPLSALQFSGSAVQVTNAWKKVAVLAANEATIEAVAQARAAIGELLPAPTPAPSAASAGEGGQSGGGNAGGAAEPGGGGQAGGGQA